MFVVIFCHLRLCFLLADYSVKLLQISRKKEPAQRAPSDNVIVMTPGEEMSNITLTAQLHETKCFRGHNRSYICPREPHVVGITLLPKCIFTASSCKSLPHSRYLRDTTGRLPKSALSASSTFLRSLTLAERRVRPSSSMCVLLLCAPHSGFSAVSVALPVQQITRRRHSR